MDKELTPEELKLKIEQLEQIMLHMPNDKSTIELKHYFVDGMYAREGLIPKGMVFTGRVHKFGHMCVISKGDISVLTENGIERLKGPCIIVSKPGVKRVGYAHEDTHWTNFHPTMETDVDKIEDHLTVPSYAHFEEYKRLLLGNK